jgi:hypothetical protein
VSGGAASMCTQRDRKGFALAPSFRLSRRFHNSRTSAIASKNRLAQYCFSLRDIAFGIDALVLDLEPGRWWKRIGRP